MFFVNPINEYGLQRENRMKNIRTAFKAVVEKFKGLYIQRIFLHENNENKHEPK